MIQAHELLSVAPHLKDAEHFANTINHWLETETKEACWQNVVNTLLTPALPFKLHLYLYKTIFENNSSKEMTAPAYFPIKQDIATSNLQQFMERLKFTDYETLHQWSYEDPNAFWQATIESLNIVFDRAPQNALSLPIKDIESPKWFPKGKLNIANSCFLAPQKQTAILYQNRFGEMKTCSYEELNKLSNQIANSLCQQGMKPGDKISILLPLTMEAVAIYLGVIKAGCVAVSIAESFSSDEIAKRVKISDTQMIFTQHYLYRGNSKIPLYEKIIEHESPTIIVLSHEQKEELPKRNCDISWETFLSDDTSFDALSRDPEDHINILFSSGTTAAPKAIPWTQTTPIKCASDAYFHHNIKPKDIISWPTSLGWMMGPWSIFAAFLNQATLALYYDAPTTREFCEFVQNAKVTMLGVVPSLVKIWRENKFCNDLDWSQIKVFSSTGECSNAEDMLYLMSRANYKPIIEYCGGTEIGGGYITSTVIQPNIPSCFSTPAMGLNFILINEKGEETTSGEIALIPPSVGLSNTLLNKNHHNTYYKDMPKSPEGHVLRRHGDHIERLKNNYYRALGRIDDTMNLGGIKVSSAEIERVLNKHKEVYETAAIAVNPENGGASQLIIYAVIKDKNSDTDELKKSLQSLIKTKLNPLFKISQLKIIDQLPRTPSNKVMRRVLKSLQQTLKN